MRPTETEIQSLKAQDAKDLAVSLLHELEERERGPISPGEVQLRELEYELRHKEAQMRDQREKEQHEQRVQELMLQIEQEKTRQQEANRQADRVLRDYAGIIEQTQQAEEALSVKLERATRQHNVKLEQLESQYDAKMNALRQEHEELEQQRDSLREEIRQLADLEQQAENVQELKQQLQTQRDALHKTLQELEEEFANAQHEKNKKINTVRRAQELELTRLETDHAKQVMQANREAADKILAELGLQAVAHGDLERLQRESVQHEALRAEEIEELREAALAEFRRMYNLTSSEPTDVTELYYRQQALTKELESLTKLAAKQDEEIRRMRQHIEQEPQRLAAAVEAAKVHVQNTIEQSRKG